MYVTNAEINHVSENAPKKEEAETTADQTTRSSTNDENATKNHNHIYKTPTKHNNSAKKTTSTGKLTSSEKETATNNGCLHSVNIRLDLSEKLSSSAAADQSSPSAAVLADIAKTPVKVEESSDKRGDDTVTHHSNKENKVTTNAAVASTAAVTEDCKNEPNLLCAKCGQNERKKWTHDNCKGKCCKSTYVYCDRCVRHKISSRSRTYGLLRDLKYGKYMYIIKCPNGGGFSLHMDFERIAHLKEEEQRDLAKEFLRQSFKEDRRGFALFTIAVVHNGARYMPDLLKLIAELRPTLPVKTTKLKCNIETEVMDLGTYYSKVKETYNNGTFAFGPLNETQIASVKNDECGAYMPELLSLLEKSPFLNRVLPWGDFTTKKIKSPHESDDGPIIWCRPGEQIVSLDKNSKRNRWNADEIEAFLKERKQNLKDFSEKRMIVEELKKYRRSYSSREFLFEDRTKPHADQVWGNHFEPTAAVGVIQAIHPDESPEQNSACKEIIVFHAKHFEILEALLHIDVTAAPKQQCAEWLDDAKLNMIRQMKIGYSKMHLYDNDIYFIPRKIVHQFKTISATLSIAWHTRLMDYYRERKSTHSSSSSGSHHRTGNSDKKSSSKSSSSHRSNGDGGDNSAAGVHRSASKKKKKSRSRTPPPASSSSSSSASLSAKKKKKSRSRSNTPSPPASSSRNTAAAAATTTTTTPNKHKSSSSSSSSPSSLSSSSAAVAARKRKEEHKSSHGESKRVKTEHNDNRHHNSTHHHHHHHHHHRHNHSTTTTTSDETAVIKKESAEEEQSVPEINVNNVDSMTRTTTSTTIPSSGDKVKDEPLDEVATATTPMETEENDQQRSRDDDDDGDGESCKAKNITLFYPRVEIVDIGACLRNNGDHTRKYEKMGKESGTAAETTAEKVNASHERIEQRISANTDTAASTAQETEERVVNCVDENK